jgi:hypothetical protein
MSGRTTTLPEIFAKYAGMQIPHEDYEQVIRDNKYTFQRPTKEGEQLLSEIYKVAADNNVNLRLWTPGAMGTMDYVPSRLNIKTDASWVIKNECSYG